MVLDWSMDRREEHKKKNCRISSNTVKQGSPKIEAQFGRVSSILGRASFNAFSGFQDRIQVRSSECRETSQLNWKSFPIFSLFVV